MVEPVVGEIIAPNKGYTWVAIIDGKLVYRNINEHTMEFLKLVEATGMQLVKIETDPEKQLNLCPNLYFRNKYISDEHAKVFWDKKRWNISFSEGFALDCKSISDTIYPLLKL